MEKFIAYLIAFLVILLGIPNITTCVGFALERSGVVGSHQDLQKNELQNAECKGYSITYNLNDGVLVVVNPEFYTLFSEDITLNNPTKETYEFIGWTGSNGETPQLTVTIGSGSCGDLEFTANFIRVLDDVKLSLNDSTLIWNVDEKVEEYQICINDEVVKTITDINTLDIHTLDEFFVEGENSIVVKATACDYKTSISNELKYTYVDLTEFENQTLYPIYFNRLSDGYTVENGAVILTYSLSGELIGCIYGGDSVLDLEPEEAFLSGLNSKKNKSNLILNGITLFDLILQLDDLYTGNANLTHVVNNGMFSFVINDTLKTIFTPQNTTLEIVYQTMYEESAFNEGAFVDLSECTSNNSFAVGFAGWAGSGGSNFLTEIFLVDTDNKTYALRYYDQFQINNTYYEIGNDVYTEANFNSALENVKFYLNDDYYFMLKVDASELIKDFYSEALEQRVIYENSIGNTSPNNMNIWSYESIDYQCNLNEYFTVYSSDGTEVDFNYVLYCTYNTVRYL